MGPTRFGLSVHQNGTRWTLFFSSLSNAGRPDPFFVRANSSQDGGPTRFDTLRNEQLVGKKSSSLYMLLNTTISLFKEL